MTQFSRILKGLSLFVVIGCGDGGEGAESSGENSENEPRRASGGPPRFTILSQESQYGSVNVQVRMEGNNTSYGRLACKALMDGSIIGNGMRRLQSGDLDGTYDIRVNIDNNNYAPDRIQCDFEN
jgi:hypothetical protein